MPDMQKGPKVGLPAGYAVNRDGRVFSMVPWRGQGFRELAQQPHSDGYMTVRVVSSDGRRRRLRVHQIVANYYIGPRPSPAHEVRHIDGDPRNNKAENLAWGTRAENAADRGRHGRTSRGEKHSNAIRRGQAAARSKATGGAQ